MCGSNYCDLLQEFKIRVKRVVPVIKDTFLVNWHSLMNENPVPSFMFPEAEQCNTINTQY